MRPKLTTGPGRVPDACTPPPVLSCTDWTGERTAGDKGKAAEMPGEPVLACQPPGGATTLPRTAMEEDAAEEEQRQTKRPAEDDGAEGSAKRPKPPPSPTEWWEADTATAELVHGVREELATLYDPKRRGFLCCRAFGGYACDPTLFDHDEEWEKIRRDQMHLHRTP